MPCSGYPCGIGAANVPDPLIEVPTPSIRMSDANAIVCGSGSKRPLSRVPTIALETVTAATTRSILPSRTAPEDGSKGYSGVRRGAGRASTPYALPFMQSACLGAARKGRRG